MPSARAPTEDLEREIRRIGAELAAAFPSAARHPMRALDARATINPIVISAAPAWTAINHLAAAVKGIVSVGLNAVAFVNDVYR